MEVRGRKWLGRTLCSWDLGIQRHPGIQGEGVEIEDQICFGEIAYFLWPEYLIIALGVNINTFIRGYNYWEWTLDTLENKQCPEERQSGTTDNQQDTVFFSRVGNTWGFHILHMFPHWLFLVALAQSHMPSQNLHAQTNSSLNPFIHVLLPNRRRNN